MSKELIEKWKKRELTLGSYYVKDATSRVFIDEYIEVLYGDVKRRVFRYEEVIVEVVARVPSHDQFVELTEKANQFSQTVKKVEKLEKQLNEANELLKAYGTESLWESLSLSCDEAKEYCKKWGMK